MLLNPCRSNGPSVLRNMTKGDWQELQGHGRSCPKRQSRGSSMVVEFPHTSQEIRMIEGKVAGCLVCTGAASGDSIRHSWGAVLKQELE